jgi:hypothetical protein
MRFKVLGIAWDGWCVPLYIDSRPRSLYQVQESNGEPAYPYRARDLPVCPHCTTGRNWNRWRRVD